MVSLVHNSAFAGLLHFVSHGRLFKPHSVADNIFEAHEHYFSRNENTGEIIVGWYGDSDPENPYNWSFTYKLWVNTLLFVMMLSVYMGSSIVSPGIPDLANYFGVSETVGVLSMSLFIWGYGIGPCILSPITEISWVGRNGPYIIGLGLFTVMQIPNALVNNVAGYMILRFINGFLGSPVLATGGATVGDIWRIEGGFMNGLAFWGLGAYGGPTLGPLIAGFAAQNLGWRWTIWPLFCLNGFVWILLFFTFPETNSETILSRRAAQLRKLTGNNMYCSRGEIKDRQFSMSMLLVETLYRPMELTITEPVLLCSNIYIAYLYGILYCFFEAFPLALKANHHFSTGLMGISYISGFVGVIITFALFCIYNMKSVIPRFKEGKWRPEYRMEPAFIGGLFFPLSMFWFGWTTFPSIHWAIPVIAFSVFLAGTFLLFQGFLSYIGENFPRYLASAYASNGLFRAALGGAFPLFATPLFKRLGLPGGCSLLGGVATILVPITVVFYLYGGKLRAMSRRTGREPAQTKDIVDSEMSSTKDDLGGLNVA